MTHLLDPIGTTSREGTSIEISRQLLAYLLTGNVQPGQRLPPERRLAEMFGVGRSIVHEAINSLTVLGLLEVRLGDGTYVKRTDAEILPQTIDWGLVIGTRDVLDVAEAWRNLEVIVAGLAAHPTNESDIAALRSLLAAAKRQQHDAEGWRTAEAAILRRVGESADNMVLNTALATIRSLLQVWLARLPHSDVRTGASLAFLGATIDAIERADADDARAAMARYVDHASEGLHDILPEESAAEHSAIHSGG